VANCDVHACISGALPVRCGRAGMLAKKYQQSVGIIGMREGEPSVCPI
jgi:hypothetical protein